LQRSKPPYQLFAVGSAVSLFIAARRLASACVRMVCALLSRVSEDT